VTIWIWIENQKGCRLDCPNGWEIFLMRKERNVWKGLKVSEIIALIITIKVYAHFSSTLPKMQVLS
jgi:hypothetical protein